MEIVMDVTHILQELNNEMAYLDEAIQSLQRLASARAKGPGRPPGWMSTQKRRGRPPGSKNKVRTEKAQPEKAMTASS
jgi:hypothetical protein